MSLSIILCTVNARYSHASFGLRRVWSALGALKDSARIQEYTLEQTPTEIAESLLALRPTVIGFGVYIWNVSLITQVVSVVRAVRPDITLVLGGPEMRGDISTLPVVRMADYVVVGEGEVAFSELMDSLARGMHPADKLLQGASPILDTLADPYDAYTDTDIAHRVVYVESSRGCPRRCVFCLSSTDGGVRYFPLTPFLGAMTRLLERGARKFKFVDRTFNLDEARVDAILRFFLERPEANMGLHFEIMPDHLTPAMRESIAAFPPGALHLEVGVQSISPVTQRLIERRQNVEKSLETIEWLCASAGAQVHADLIVGLPGDAIADVARGFDALVRAGVHELQVGILKGLRGSPLLENASDSFVFASWPPYEALQTPGFSFAEMQEMKRFARFVDLYYNSGNFPKSLGLLWRCDASPFAAFSRLVHRVWTCEGRTHRLTLARQAEHLYRQLVEEGRHTTDEIACIIEQDFRRLEGRRDVLPFLGE